MTRRLVEPGALEEYFRYIAANGVRPRTDVPEFPGGEGHWERGRGWVPPSRAGVRLGGKEEDDG